MKKERIECSLRSKSMSRFKELMALQIKVGFRRGGEA